MWCRNEEDGVRTRGSESFTGWGALLVDMRGTSACLGQSLGMV